LLLVGTKKPPTLVDGIRHTNVRLLDNNYKLCLSHQISLSAPCV
ncbi:uncharacterized protein METZ01_LOCUS374253, partial [marine metagenome]